jgi:hypothetical protein
MRENCRENLIETPQCGQKAIAVECIGKMYVCVLPSSHARRLIILDGLSFSNSSHNCLDQQQCGHFNREWGWRATELQGEVWNKGRTKHTKCHDEFMIEYTATTVVVVEVRVS